MLVMHRPPKNLLLTCQLNLGMHIKNDFSRTFHLMATKTRRITQRKLREFKVYKADLNLISYRRHRNDADLALDVQQQVGNWTICFGIMLLDVKCRARR